MALAGTVLAGCADGGSAPADGAAETAETGLASGWLMPAEERPHERTWMCWPWRSDVWDGTLIDVQGTVADIALAIAEFEPVTMLARPAEIAAVRRALGQTIEILAAPVDDLWARDTLPNFLVRRAPDGPVGLRAGHATFNGWGGKQVHAGDTRLAALVADHLGIELSTSGLTGEGGGLEVDGAGTVLATESSWVNANRNPGRSRAQIELALLSMLAADRVIWLDGLAGHDITDGHVDTLARFASESTIVVDRPAFADRGDPWVGVARRTKAQVTDARTRDGRPYDVIEISQPRDPRGTGDDFLSTYMNYYVCNGAVIAPQFGDRRADAAAKGLLEDLFPSREIVLLNIDPLAAGGGGIHCATQQQPASSTG